MGTSESDLVTAIKNNYFNYIEIANLLTDGLIFLGHIKASVGN